MMMRWVFASRIEPADIEGTISARCGCNVFFAAFSKVTGWLWIYPGGEEKIAEPQMLFVDEEWAREHPRRSPVISRENPLRIRKQKVEQLRLL